MDSSQNNVDDGTCTPYESELPPFYRPEDALVPPLWQRSSKGAILLLDNRYFIHKCQGPMKVDEKSVREHSDFPSHTDSKK